MPELINWKDLNFLLYDVFNATDLHQYARYAAYDQTSFDSILDTAHKIAQQYFAPHHAKADQHEPTFEGQSVQTLPEVKIAWQHFAKAGFIGAQHDENLGGMQLPKLIHMAVKALFMSANPSSVAYPFLTSAAANVIHAFGNTEQKQLFLQPMLEGRFAGTMVLTEPNVGSSLGDLTTKANPYGAHYLLKGQKMFISGGDQDITENIVHLVLARIEGAPAGVKGISLFIVPKFLVNRDGTLGSRNDVHLAGLLHKMGYRGTTSTVLNFGENDQCLGYLIGEAGDGLKYMFKMMNEARVGVGLGAAMIGYRGYLESLNYAKQRPQGRLPSEKSSHTQPVAIIEHSDVKRMLLAQKSYVEGSLALCLFAARLIDDAQGLEPQDQHILLDLLTPIVKSFPSEYGPKANDLAIQVLGGAGYTKDYPVEQCYRDNRLNPIHEGTTGIQALDLLARKIWQKDSRGLTLLMQHIERTLKQVSHPELAKLANIFREHLNTAQQTTTLLGQHLQRGNVDLSLANASLYLDLMGKVVVAWLWLEMGNHAERCFAHSQQPQDQNFWQGKLQAARYFITWELPQIEQHAKILQRLDRTCLDMQANWF